MTRLHGLGLNLGLNVSMRLSCYHDKDNQDLVNNLIYFSLHKGEASEKQNALAGIFTSDLDVLDTDGSFPNDYLKGRHP